MSIATIGTLSGAEVIFQSWCQSSTDQMNSTRIITPTTSAANLTVRGLNLRFAIPFVSN